MTGKKHKSNKPKHKAAVKTEVKTGTHADDSVTDCTCTNCAHHEDEYEVNCIKNKKRLILTLSFSVSKLTLMKK